MLDAAVLRPFPSLTRHPLSRRQWREAAERRYFGDDAARLRAHGALADFFQGRWSRKLKDPLPLRKNRSRPVLDGSVGVPDQPVWWGSALATGGDFRALTRFNFRRLAELGPSLLACGPARDGWPREARAFLSDPAVVFAYEAGFSNQAGRFTYLALLARHLRAVKEAAGGAENGCGTVPGGPPRSSTVSREVAARSELASELVTHTLEAAKRFEEAGHEGKSFPGTFLTIIGEHLMRGQANYEASLKLREVRISRI